MKKLKNYFFIVSILFALTLILGKVYANSVGFTNVTIARYQGWNYISGCKTTSSSYSYCDGYLSALSNTGNGVTFYAAPDGQQFTSSGTVFTSTGVHRSINFQTSAPANKGVSIKYRSHDFNLSNGTMSGTIKCY